MAREDYFILDSDLHLMEPYDLWERHLEGTQSEPAALFRRASAPGGGNQSRRRGDAGAGDRGGSGPVSSRLRNCGSIPSIRPTKFSLTSPIGGPNCSQVPFHPNGDGDRLATRTVATPSTYSDRWRAITHHQPQQAEKEKRGHRRAAADQYRAHAVS
jgi:hypothetical protein